MDKQAGAKRRRKVRRFTAERRAQFLEHLRRTGNQSAAAKAIGLHRDNAEKRRKRDAEFAIQCAAAEAEAAQRLAGASDPFEGVIDAEFETIKRGRGGRPQIVATRKGKWCKSTEDLFFDALRGCGNIAASARAVGFSESSVWRRRRQWPGFARRMGEALEEAEIVLEFRLATLGNNVGAGEESAEGCPSTTTGSGQASLRTNEREEVPFDPELALRFLKWRAEKRAGRGKTGRHHGPRKPSIEEVRDEILRRIKAIRRHRELHGGGAGEGDG